MKTRQEMKARAREALREQRGTAILLLIAVSAVTLISAIIDEIVLRAFGDVAYWVVYWIGMLIIYVATVNMAGEYIKIYEGEGAGAGAVFSGFGVNFLRKLGGMAWMTLWLAIWGMAAVFFYTFTITILAFDGEWGLLALISVGGLTVFIPAIVKLLEYHLTPYILASCPDVGARAALRLSSRMMQKYRGTLLMLMLSFIGWGLLSVFTFFILAIVFVLPYFYIASAGFFVELRNLAIEDGTVTREELGMETKREDDRGYGFGSGVFEG